MSAPRVSVVIAAHDAARHLRQAVDSVLRQTLADLEVVVVDDASTDATPDVLAALGDPRLVVLRNEVNRGLAASLNRGLEAARAPYVARLDADDVALPGRLERQLAELQRRQVAVLGAGVLEIDADGRPGALHDAPCGDAAVRWRCLFGAPFFHPTVLLDRWALAAHDLRYDESLGESEDFDLWQRALAVLSGDNMPATLVLRRVHAGQASRRRRDLQRSIQRDVALRAIGAVAPDLGAERTELAWRVGALEPAAARPADAADAFVALWRAFAEAHAGRPALDGARLAAAGTLLRFSDGDPRIAAQALAIAPALPARAGLRSVSRRRRAARAAETASGWLEALDRGTGVPAVRVALVSPEPTPYRSPLLDRVSDRPEVELTVVYTARTVVGRAWEVEPRHRAVFLEGRNLPGLRRVLHHDYPVTPGIARALADARPDVVVVTGWSTFASQAAIAWARARGIPFLLLVSSHDEGPRSGWRRAVKAAVVPPIARSAAGALVLGTLARESLVARGVPAERIRVFANTVDVPAWEARADALAARRPALRAEWAGATPDDVVVLCVARLAPEKALDVLLRAVATADDPRLLLLLAGTGPEHDALERLARDLGVRARLVGDVAYERLPELYVAADVFVLVSHREPWGVVVNEAAATGLPLVVSDRVGAAPDLVRDGESGLVVPAGDVERLAGALALLASDSGLRRSLGDAARRVMAGWGYAPSVDAFVDAVREAADR